MKPFISLLIFLLLGQVLESQQIHKKKNKSKIRKTVAASHRKKAKESKNNAAIKIPAPIDEDTTIKRDSVLFAVNLENALAMAGSAHKFVIRIRDTTNKMQPDGLMESIAKSFNVEETGKQPILLYEYISSKHLMESSAYPSLELLSQDGKIIGKMEGFQSGYGAGLVSHIDQMEQQYQFQEISKGFDTYYQQQYKTDFIPKFIYSLRDYIDDNPNSGITNQIRDNNLILELMDTLVSRQGAALLQNGELFNNILHILWGDKRTDYYTLEGKPQQNVITAQEDSTGAKGQLLQIHPSKTRLEDSGIFSFLIDHLPLMAKNSKHDFYATIAGIHDFFRQQDPFALIENEWQTKRMDLYEKYIAALDAGTAIYHYEKINELYGWYGIYTNAILKFDKQNLGLKKVLQYFTNGLHIAAGSGTIKSIAALDANNDFLNKQTYYGATYGADALPTFNAFYLDNIALLLNDIAWQMYLKHDLSDTVLTASSLAIQLKPNNGYYLDTYAHLMYGKQKVKDAFRLEQQAILYQQHATESGSAAVLKQMKRDLHLMQMRKPLKNTQ